MDKVSRRGLCNESRYVQTPTFKKNHVRDSLSNTTVLIAQNVSCLLYVKRQWIAVNTWESQSPCFGFIPQGGLGGSKDPSKDLLNGYRKGVYSNFTTLGLKMQVKPLFDV